MLSGCDVFDARLPRPEIRRAKKNRAFRFLCLLGRHVSTKDESAHAGACLRFVAVVGHWNPLDLFPESRP